MRSSSRNFVIVHRLDTESVKIIWALNQVNMVGFCQRPEIGEIELVTIFPAMLRISKTVQGLIEPELDGKC